VTLTSSKWTSANRERWSGLVYVTVWYQQQCRIQTFCSAVNGTAFLCMTVASQSQDAFSKSNILGGKSGNTKFVYLWNQVSFWDFLPRDYYFHLIGQNYHMASCSRKRCLLGNVVLQLSVLSQWKSGYIKNGGAGE
jgi:hypothetical protein